MNRQFKALPLVVLASVLTHTWVGHCDILHDQSVRAQTEYDAAVEEVAKRETELGAQLNSLRKDVANFLMIGAARDRYLAGLQAIAPDSKDPYTGDKAWLANLCGGVARSGVNAGAPAAQPPQDAGAPAPPPAPPSGLGRDACAKLLTDAESKIRATEGTPLANTDPVDGHLVQKALDEAQSALQGLKDKGGHVADSPILAGFCQLSQSTPLAGAVAQCDKQLASYLAIWNAFKNAQKVNQELVGAVEAAKTRKNKAEAAKNLALSNESQSSTPTNALTLADRLHGARNVRCLTAICWGGDGTRNGVEPVIDLPVGMYWALGNGSLSNYVNSNRLDISVAAGLRIWFADDQLSLGVLLARPSLSKSGPLHIEYSDKPFPIESVGRPFPTLMVGAFGDTLIMTFSYDQLRNTDGSSPVDPKFLPGEVLSRAIVVGLALSPFTAVKNAVGASMAKPQQESK